MKFLAIGCLLLLGFMFLSVGQVHASPKPTGFHIPSNVGRGWWFDGLYWNSSGRSLLLFVSGGAVQTFTNSSGIVVGYTFEIGIGPDYMWHLPPQPVLDFFANFTQFDLNVAALTFGLFPDTTQGQELNLVIRTLEKWHGNYTSIYLVGHSGGGAAVANYLTTGHNATSAVILDAPLTGIGNGTLTVGNFLTAAYHAENLTTPTLLVYGLNDTVAPWQQNAGAWLRNSPQNMSSLQLYNYEHDPWTTPNMAGVIQHALAGFLLSIPTPENVAITYPIILLLAVAVIVRRKKVA